MKEKPINVLFLTSWYPTKSNPAAAVFVHEHALALKAAGLKLKIVQVAAVRDSTAIYRIEVNKFVKDDIEVSTIKVYSKFDKLINACWPLLYRLLKDYFSSLNKDGFTPDLIHSNVIYPAGFLGHKLASKLGVPHTITEHWTNLDWVFKKPVFNSTGTKVYESAFKVFPVSNFLANQIREKVGAKVDIKVVPNVVNPSLFYHKERKISGKIKFICVTNFWRNKKKLHKRPDVLIEALELLSKENQEQISLTFVGRGEKQQDLKEYISKSDISSEITFMGGRTKHEIAELMRNSDFLLQATEKETFGVVIAEASCIGLPCVVSELEALKELVGDENGFFVKKNTPESWAKAMIELLDGKYNFDREKISKKFQNRFSYKAVGNKYLHEYKKVLSK